MIRIVCVEADTGAAANVGGPVHQRHRTFDVEAPEVERWLAEQTQWIARSIVGVEVLASQGKEPAP